MSLKIKVKRISGVPSTSDLESGEIGLNTSNKQLYVKIVGTITAVSGGSSDAEENESSFKTISVAGQSDVVADADADTLTFTAAAPDLSSVSQDIVPDGNGTRDLGSSSNKWKELHLSGSTIFLGSAQLTADGTKVVLPTGSKDAAGNSIGVKDSALGVAIRSVPLFTAAGGLSSAATTFNMKDTQDRSLVFSDFTKANGDAISKHPGTTIFNF